MNLGRALGHFAREAGGSLLRSWKPSLLAILTIAVSLFVGGAFWLLAHNLARAVDDLRSDSRVTLYFDDGTPPARIAEVEEEVARAPWVVGMERVDGDEARRRFLAVFPSLADLIAEGEGALPVSLEVEVRTAEADSMAAAAWIEALGDLPGVGMVDDDRDWVERLAALAAVARGFGLALGVILLSAAVFTTGSVIRLIVYLYEEEIAVMRLVGATELYIRGPFYAEGLFQGLAGGALADIGLAGGYWLAAGRLSGGLPGALLFTAPPGPLVLGGILALGGAAGLLGAILSLRREALGEPPDDET